MPALPYWIDTYLMMLGVGGLFAVTFLYLLTPGPLLKYTGVLPGLTGNWISVARVPVTLAAFAIWFNADGNLALLWTGLLAVVFGLALDRLDGKVVKWVLSRLQFLADYVTIRKNGRDISCITPLILTPPLTKDNQLWAWYEVTETVITRVPRQPGSKRMRKIRSKTKVMKRVQLEDWIYRLTPEHTILPMFYIERQDEGLYRGLHLKLTGLGDVLDPGADKLCYLPVFAYMVWLGNLQMAAAIAMILVDLFGTVLRRPFDTMPGLRHLQKLVGEAKASYVGKTKVAFQIITLLVDMPASAGWLTPAGREYSYLLTSGCLWIAVALGVLSVLSRMIFWQSLVKKLGLSRFNRRFRKFYDHDVAV